ncbi:hypothetical protein QS257_20825 [Terrilactibacillus sp. S3-3]|nr:hypothetical protein QS257_20825 [Terrilactibacillus sp. S3-3]
MQGERERETAAYLDYKEQQEKARELEKKEEAEDHLPLDVKMALMKRKIGLGIGEGLVDAAKDTAYGITDLFWMIIPIKMKLDGILKHQEPLKTKEIPGLFKERSLEVEEKSHKLSLKLEITNGLRDINGMMRFQLARSQVLRLQNRLEF